MQYADLTIPFYKEHYTKFYKFKINTSKLQVYECSTIINATMDL